jgi:hypothetical protein
VFDWVFEGRFGVYLLLGILALVLVALWVRNRRREWLFAGVAVGLMALTYFMLDRMVDTPRKQIQRRLELMAKGVKERKPDDILAQVSDRFNWEGLDKEKFREFVEKNLHHVNEIKIWEERFLGEWPPPAGGPIRLEFKVKPEGPANPDRVGHFRCEAEFVQDPDGQWRMRTFQVFHPLIDTTEPIQVRQFLGQ